VVLLIIWVFMCVEEIKAIQEVSDPIFPGCPSLMGLETAFKMRPYFLHWRKEIAVYDDSGTQLFKIEKDCPAFVDDFEWSVSSTEKLVLKVRVKLIQVRSHIYVYDCHDNLVFSILETVSDAIDNNNRRDKMYSVEDQHGTKVGTAEIQHREQEDLVIYNNDDEKVSEAEQSVQLFSEVSRSTYTFELKAPRPYSQIISHPSVPAVLAASILMSEMNERCTHFVTKILPILLIILSFGCCCGGYIFYKYFYLRNSGKYNDIEQQPQQPQQPQHPKQRLLS